MKNVLKRIISILIVTVCLIGIFSIENRVSAITLGEMATDIETFKSKGDALSVDTAQMESEFAGLGKILTTIGAGVLLIVITYMGIKYFISSPEEQAKLKGQLIGVVVSAVVIFGAYSIWKMAVSIFMNM